MKHRCLSELHVFLEVRSACLRSKQHHCCAQTGSLLARSTQQQAGPRQQPAALQEQRWLPAADHPEAADGPSRTAPPQQVPQGQPAAEAERGQPEAALPSADMAELRARLAGAEAAGAAAQAEIQRVKEVLGARVTILEGTVRFLEGGSPYARCLQELHPPKALGRILRGLAGSRPGMADAKLPTRLGLCRLTAKWGLGPSCVSPTSHPFLCGQTNVTETCPRLELRPPVPGLQGS